MHCMHRVNYGTRGRTMMAEQDWVMAGIYLVGLVSMALLMSALSARATRERPTVSTVRAQTRHD